MTRDVKCSNAIQPQFCASITFTFKLPGAELEVKKHNFPNGISAAGTVRQLVPASVRHWLVQHVLPKREQHYAAPNQLRHQHIYLPPSTLGNLSTS